MAVIHTHGLCLRVGSFSESSQVARFLTPTGNLSVIARGIKRKNNPFQGPLDVLAVYELEYSERRDHDGLHLLRRARQVEWYGELRTSLGAWYGAEMVRELLLRIPTPEAEAEATLRLAIEALRALAKGHSPVAVGARLMASLLRMHGMTPELAVCPVSGRKASGSTPVAFCYTDFAILSPLAARGRKGLVQLSPRLLYLLRVLFDTRTSQEEFRVDLWEKAFTVLCRLTGIALGTTLVVPEVLLDEWRVRA